MKDSKSVKIHMKNGEVQIHGSSWHISEPDNMVVLTEVLPTSETEHTYYVPIGNILYIEILGSREAE